MATKYGIFFVLFLFVRLDYYGWRLNKTNGNTMRQFTFAHIYETQTNMKLKTANKMNRKIKIRNKCYFNEKEEWNKKKSYSTFLEAIHCSECFFFLSSFARILYIT